MPPPLDAEPDPFQLFAEPWRAWWSYTGACGRAGLEWMALWSDPAPLRSRWLAGVSQMLDRYVRSPAFLELTRHNLRALTALARLKSPIRPR